MFTPQEIQEKTFVKAVFGGYDMETVDEFLEPLTEDYITLYKENAVLKSKMKVLVEKLEEYRSQEQSMRKAILSAQRTADAMVAEAEKKCAKIMTAAETTAQSKTSDADEVVAQEQARMDSARETAQDFIEKLETEIRSHLDLLENLKKQDLAVRNPTGIPVRQKAYDFEKEADQPLVVPQNEPPKETTEDIANEIEQNITRMMDLDEPAPEPAPAPAAKNGHMDSSTIKFTNLQFGRNYDPTNG